MNDDLRQRIEGIRQAYDFTKVCCRNREDELMANKVFIDQLVAVVEEEMSKVVEQIEDIKIDAPVKEMGKHYNDGLQAAIEVINYLKNK